MTPSLADYRARRFTLTEIGDAIGIDQNTLRAWLRPGERGGRVALDPEADEISHAGGRAHGLGWRTTLKLLIAVRLNALGFMLRGGEAAAVAESVMTAGLEFDHLASRYSPLIVIRPKAGSVIVTLVERSTPADMIEAPMKADGFDGIGSIILEPIAFGRIIWALGKAQDAAAMLAAEDLAAAPVGVLSKTGAVRTGNFTLTLTKPNMKPPAT